MQQKPPMAAGGTRIGRTLTFPELALPARWLPRRHLPQGEGGS